MWGHQGLPNASSCRVSNPYHIEHPTRPALVCMSQSTSNAVTQRILTIIYVYGNVTVAVLRFELSWRSRA